MSRLAELLDAIRAAPDDDALRAIYADALEDAGEVRRAQFLRTALAGGEGERDDGTPEPIRRAAQWSFDRGLVTHVEADVVTWLAAGGEMFASAPIWSIVLHDPDDDDHDLDAIARELGEQAWLGHVRALELPMYAEVSESVVHEMLPTQQLDRVRALRVGHPLIAIDALPSFPELRALTVICEGAEEGDDILALSARRGLEDVELVGCGVTLEGVRAAAAMPLRRLVLAGTHYAEDDVGVAGIRALVDGLTRLETLELETAGIDDEAVRVLATARWPLRRLSLANNPITDAGLAALAPLVGALRWLNLEGTSVTADGIAQVRRANPSIDIRR